MAEYFIDLLIQYHFFDQKPKEIVLERLLSTVSDIIFLIYVNLCY